MHLKYDISLLGTYMYVINCVVAPKSKNTFPLHSMTNDPEKIWPGGTVSYMLDPSLSKFSLGSCASTGA